MDDDAVCDIGGVNDGSLRTCCSKHTKVLCAHHYARTHFVETSAAWPASQACTERVARAMAAFDVEE